MVNRSFSSMVQFAADGQRNIQLLSRAMTNGILSERDRLYQYSLGEFYEEMSLFIQEAEIQKAQFDKLREK